MAQLPWALYWPTFWVLWSPCTLTSCWIQPIWKICASQNGWTSSPSFGMKRNKYLSCHHPGFSLEKTNTVSNQLNMRFPGVGTSTFGKPGRCGGISCVFGAQVSRCTSLRKVGDHPWGIPSPALSWWFSSRSVFITCPRFILGLKREYIKNIWKKHLETHMVLISDLESLLGGRSIFQGLYPFLESACQMAKQTDGWKCSRITWPLQKKKGMNMYDIIDGIVVLNMCAFIGFFNATIWSTKLPSSRLPRRLKQHETTI